MENAGAPRGRRIRVRAWRIGMSVDAVIYRRLVSVTLRLRNVPLRGTFCEWNLTARRERPVLGAL